VPYLQKLDQESSRNQELYMKGMEGDFYESANMQGVLMQSTTGRVLAFIQVDI